MATGVGRRAATGCGAHSGFSTCHPALDYGGAVRARPRHARVASMASGTLLNRVARLSGNLNQPPSEATDVLCPEKDTGSSRRIQQSTASRALLAPTMERAVPSPAPG